LQVAGNKLYFVCSFFSSFYCEIYIIFSGQWCIFREGDGQKDGNIASFNCNSLKKCSEILAIRRSKDLKYKNVVLPEKTGGSEGYHMSCYRRFTALNKEYMKLDPICTTVNYTTRSKTTSFSSTSTGILPKNCNFCGKKDKKHNNKKQPLVSSVETVNFEEKIKEYANLFEDHQMLAKLGDVDFVA